MDIFSLIKTLAIVFLTGFFCMALYYAICILRRVHRILENMEKKADSLFDTWKEFHARLLGLRTSLDIIASGCRAALSLYQRRMTRDMDDTDSEHTEEDKPPLKQKSRKST